jgi:outer membrane protein assembly factor BamB
LQPDAAAFQSHSPADQEWLSSVLFASAPTYEAGLLYVQAVTVSGGSYQAFAAAFDAETGHLEWRQEICSANAQDIPGWPLWADLGLPAAVSQGQVFIVTNLGAVASLEAASGTLKWIRIYDRTEIEARVDRSARSTPPFFWAPNPPIVCGNVLIATPQDSELLYAYDIETGGRLWEIHRDLNDPNDQDRLQHILGIIAGQVVVSGANIHFYGIKSGKKNAPAVVLESPVKGRGLATENMVLVPTEKALVRLAVQDTGGTLSVQRLDSQDWTEPAREAGNIFVAGSMLFTASRTHLNAYFDPEELERKLKERIASRPDECNAWLELLDIYRLLQRHDDALRELELAMETARKMSPEPKTAGFIAALQTRKFETLMALGESCRKDKTQAAQLQPALDYFKKALAVTEQPGLAADLPICALRSLAETAAQSGANAEAARYYQQIIAAYGETLYTPRSFTPEQPGQQAAETKQRFATKAALFAQSKIEELKKKDSKCYEAIEAEAQAALAQGADDTKRLSVLLARYPNANACGEALLRLARLALNSNPSQAHQYCQRYLRAFHDEVAAANVLLAQACEREKLLGPAKDVLRRLASRQEFANATIQFDPQTGSVGGAPLNVAEWAGRRLAEPQFQRPSSEARWSLGSGHLKPAWAKAALEPRTPLFARGLAPAAMRGNVFFVEKQELVALAASEKGAELWSQRPKLPAGFKGALWAGTLLIAWGDNELVAFDSVANGQVVWRRSHLAGAGSAPCFVQASEQRLAVVYPNAVLGVLDTASGSELWNKKLEGFIREAACGEGFLAVETSAALTSLNGDRNFPNGPGFAGPAQSNQATIYMFDLENGIIHRQDNIVLATANPEGQPGIRMRPRLATGESVMLLEGRLQAAGDRLYSIEMNNMLRVYDGHTGKLAWEYAFSGPVTMLSANRDLVAAVVNQRQVEALSTEAAGERKAWLPQLPEGKQVFNLLIDGDGLYVELGDQQGVKAEVDLFSIPKQGSKLWAVEIASTPVNALPLAGQYLATGHLAASINLWDPTGAMSTDVVLVDRVTGKRIWNVPLSNEGRPFYGTMEPSFSVSLFEGGLVLTEDKKQAAFIADDAPAKSFNAEELRAQLAKAPQDPELLVKLAGGFFDRGEQKTGFDALTKAMSEKGLSEAAFTALYDELARRRQDCALKTKPLFTFVKASQPPKLDGGTESWAAFPEVVLDGWKDVYLASENEVVPAIKQPAWKGPKDFRVSFRGAYDEKNLYLQFVAFSASHKNEQSEEELLDLGDSVKVVFDIGRDGGVGYRGKDFDLGLALNSTGKTLFHRWVENGRYVGANSPLPATTFVKRNEAEKQTVYQFALPLDYLGLKPETGTKFGFSFAVNSQGAETQVEKSICASPGINPPYPSLYAEGIMDK